MGAGGAVRFGEYLRKLGLMETRRSSRIDAQAAMDNAARIVAMDSKRHG